MTNKEKAIEIVTNMVKNGYHLFDETFEAFAQRMNYDVELLEMFSKKFNEHVKK